MTTDPNRSNPMIDHQIGSRLSRAVPFSFLTTSDFFHFQFSDLSKSLIIYNEAQKSIWMSHYLIGFVSIDNAATYPGFSGLIGLKVWPLFSFQQFNDPLKWERKVLDEILEK